MKKLIVMILVLAMAGFSITFLNAAPRPYLQKHMRFGNNFALNSMIAGKFILKFKKELGLTPGQLQKIEKMNYSIQESMIKTTADLKLLEIKLGNYLRSEKMDRKQAVKMMRNIGRVKTDMQINMMNYRFDLKDVLTPEQLTKIEAMKKKMARRMRRAPRRERVPRGNRPPRRGGR